MARCTIQSIKKMTPVAARLNHNAKKIDHIKALFRSTLTFEAARANGNLLCRLFNVTSENSLHNKINAIIDRDAKEKEHLSSILINILRTALCLREQASILPAHPNFRTKLIEEIDLFTRCGVDKYGLQVDLDVDISQEMTDLAIRPRPGEYSCFSQLDPHYLFWLILLIAQTLPKGCHKMSKCFLYIKFFLQRHHRQSDRPSSLVGSTCLRPQQLSPSISMNRSCPACQLPN